MRVLWSSNSPFVGSGYGMQTAVAARRLRSMGHDVAIFAFWGLAGSRVDWGDIPIYPNNPADWGVKHAPLFYDDWKADILVTLVDAWVLQQLDPRIRWVPWCVTGETEVITSNGKMPIKDASDAKEVLATSEDGELKWAKVEAFHKLPVRTQIYEITTKNRKLFVTAENEIWTQDGWKPACCIEPSDMVYCTYDKPTCCDNTVGLHSRVDRWRGLNNNNHSPKIRQENAIPIMAPTGYKQPKSGSYGLVEGNDWDRLSKQSACIGTPKFKRVDIQANGIHLFNYGDKAQACSREYYSVFDNKETTGIKNNRVFGLPQDPSVQHVLHQQRTGDDIGSKAHEFKEWERVIEVRKSSRQVDAVFDLTTSTGSFFANGILIHNCPIDHDPAPPAVIATLQRSAGLVKPIAMSKFGLEQLKKNDIDAYYIPHTVNTELFRPVPEWRNVGRQRYKWENKFVIGTVATNHIERKNWIAGMKAVAKFEKMHPGEVIYYMHTNPIDERGINLLDLRKALDIERFTKFPSQAEMVIGIEMETMARMYNALDVFLLPTKGEGFGIPLIEAQACGVPVITTDCTAQTELFGGGWLIKDLNPMWTAQSSWQFDCNVDEVVELLEKAYQAKKSAAIIEQKEAALKKAREYDESKIYSEYWPDVLADIEKRIKEPKSLEGVQPWRLAFIPQTCVPRKVLDIGCGSKQTYRKYLEGLGQYVGVDIKDGNNPAVVVADAHNLPFRDGEFGFVWCSEMLEHVDDPARVLAEAKRVGKHGVCLFSTPQNQFYKMDPSHKRVKLPYTTVATGDGLISW